MTLPGEPGARTEDPDGLREAEVEGDAGDDLEEFAVRPYTVTGGRTRPTTLDLPFEALVEAVAQPVVSMTPERRRILELATDQYVSLAELSAHLHLPLGVVRVVVGDLADAGQVRVHGSRTTTTAGPASTISVLESVLHGIFSL